MCNKKRLLLIITEGPTDEEFYKKVLKVTKKSNDCSKYSFDEIKYMCANGISNMHKSMLGKFNFEICQNSEFRDYYKVVCFCYDLDVFKRKRENPPINRNQMLKDFQSAGADKIISIVADDMIEDFFLYDIEGVKKYLKLGSKYKIPNKKSLDLIKQMFKDGNRIYYKGTLVKGLVDALNVEKILVKICDQVSALCDELGYNCNKKTCINNSVKIK